MTKIKRLKTYSHPKIQVSVGVALLAIIVLLIKDRPRSATIATTNNDLPEAQLYRTLQVWQPTLAFFRSTNYRQCIVMMGIMAKVYPEFSSTVTLVDVNVYDEKNASLLQRVSLQFIPTLIFYDHIGRGRFFVGVMEAEQLNQILAILTGTFIDALKCFQQMERWSDVIEKASGVIVIGVGLYFLWIA